MPRPATNGAAVVTGAQLGVVDRDDLAAGAEVRIREHRGHVVHDRGRDARGDQRVDRVGRRPCRHPLADHGVERVDVLETRAVGPEARVVGELGAADRGEEARDELVRAGGDARSIVRRAAR